jgi:ubiquinone/menaquinone biosynthesis C-methylase UbiE
MTATLGVERPKKGYKGVGMDGAIARWYARTTGKSIEQFRVEARALAAQLAPGSGILEVAPGPGYLAIELARLGDFHIVGLDISKTFVELAAENARKAGVTVDFQLGNAAAMPFPQNSFELIVCRAAFKNFSEPIRALAEMHRVLKSGGKAIIFDLRPDASPGDIAAAVAGMNLGWLNSQITKLTFKHMLLKRAHSNESIRQMAAQTPFETCQIREAQIGLEITLVKA